MRFNIIAYYLLNILIVAVAVQFSSFGIIEDVYNIFRNFIMGMILVIFLFSLNKTSKFHFIKSRTFIIHSVVIILSILVFLFIYGVTGIEINISPVRDLILSLAILIIGINLDLTQKQFNGLISLYVFLFSFSALSIVFTYAEGFNILDQYLPVPKNQFAPAHGIAFLLSLFLLFKKGTKIKLIYLIPVILLFACMLVIRGRAVLVSVFLTVFIFLFFYIKSKKIRFFAVALILALIPYIGSAVYEALFLNYDISDLDSISTGRYQRNIEGIDFLSQYPLFGELEHELSIPTIHNYFLYVLTAYGLLLGLVVLLPYFRYIVITIKSIKGNEYKYYEVGPLVMIILLSISLLEYTYPYAPGSATFFPFFLVGQYLRIDNIYNKRHL